MVQGFKYKLSHNNQHLWLRQITFREKQIFNSFIECSDFGTVFQSYEWGDLKKNHGWLPIRLLLEGKNNILGAATILKRTMAGMTFFYSPRGPVLDYCSQPHLLSLFCRGVGSLARREGAIFWRIDPELPGSYFQQIFNSGNLKSVHIANPFGGVQPKWVWRIPLKNSQKEQWLILNKGARRQINKALKAGVKVREAGERDIPSVYQLLQDTAQRNKFLLRGMEYYNHLWKKLSNSSSANLKMLIAFKDQTPVATALAVGFGHGVWDIYAGNSHSNRDLGASYLLTWDLIAWASEQGYAFYDLGGIVPRVDKTHPLAGLKFFKSRFGGEEIEFVGEYDLVFKPLSYRLWHFGQKSFQLITQIKKTINFSNHFKT